MQIPYKGLIFRANAEKYATLVLVQATQLVESDTYLIDFNYLILCTFNLI